jgi:hypothetical protein
MGARDGIPAAGPQRLQQPKVGGQTTDAREGRDFSGIFGHGKEVEDLSDIFRQINWF